MLGVRDLPFVVGVALVASLVAALLFASVGAQRHGRPRRWQQACLGGGVVGAGVAYAMATLSPFSLLGAGVLPGDPEFPQNVNLVPVTDMFATRADLLVVNLALLAPFGFLMRLRWPSLGLGAIALTSITFALLIEVAQLFHPLRGTNIDDVTLNAVGSVIGAGAVAIVQRRGAAATEARDAPGSEVGLPRGR